jgi:hypothetical protein
MPAPVYNRDAIGSGNDVLYLGSASHSFIPTICRFISLTRQKVPHRHCVRAVACIALWARSQSIINTGPFLTLYSWPSIYDACDRVGMLQQTLQRAISDIEKLILEHTFGVGGRKETTAWSSCKLIGP